MLLTQIRSILDFRGLLVNLALKELRLQYKHSVLGFMWSMLNPLFMLAIYVFAFKYILHNDTPHFTLFLLIAELPWNFFQGAVLSGTNSLVNAGSLISKVYFPREVVPMSLVLSNLFNFIFTLGTLAIAVPMSHMPFNIYMAYFPIILIAQILFIIPLTLFLSIVTVIYRDVYHFMQVLLMAWFYLTPIVYPLSKVPGKFKLFMYLNPMADFVHEYRLIIFHDRSPNWGLLGGVLVFDLVILLLALLIFRRLSKNIVEYI